MTFITDIQNKIIQGMWKFLNLQPLVSENIRSLVIDEDGNLGTGNSQSTIPSGTDRQILSWDENGNPISIELTPNQWSDFPDGAPTSGQWIAAAQFDSDEQPEMGFVEVAVLGESLEYKIPFYTQNGQLPVGTPQFPENAVPLGYFDAGMSTKLDVGTGTQSATTYRRGDGTWATPSNTTYTVITEAEFNTGSSTTSRVVSAVSLNRDIQAKILSYLPTLPGYAVGAVLTVTSSGIQWVTP